MRRVLLMAAAALALVLPGAQAVLQDPSTYPAGVAEVSNTPLEAGTDFQVEVKAAGTPDSVVVTVCRFTSLDAEGPDVCFMNLQARPEGEAHVADTGAVQHPAWGDGWVVGYKVTVEAGDNEAHAPSDGDYYRIVVGSEQEPVPEGSAVVEDSPVAAEAAADPAPAASKGAPAPAGTALLGLAVAVLAAARRR